jgi:soluble lytic murein transglycosylase-like protein
MRLGRSIDPPFSPPVPQRRPRIRILSFRPRRRAAMAEHTTSGVVLAATLVKTRKKWMSRFILVNVLYLFAISALAISLVGKEKTISSFSFMNRKVEEYRTRDRLYEILRTKGYSLGQGLDIVEAIVLRSRELGLPLPLIMAVIHEESEFYPNARSSKGAVGLMQIMPIKWDEYVAKLDLKVDRRAIADPFMNITVGCQILNDLYARYSHIKDHKTRTAKVLTDYNNGENAKSPNLKYAHQVNQKVEEYEKEFDRP